MKKVRKYYPGVNGLTSTQSTGVLAPQQEDPNKFSTGKFLFPQQKTLGNIVDNKVMSQDYLSSKKGPSFMDKAGSFMGSYGDIIGSVGTGIASLINANKKQDPTGRPYKSGTNMIKYQGGTQSTKAKRNMQHIMEQNMAQNAMNFILNANVANDKRNAELNSRVAPKKLESKKANVKTDSLKTNKPNLIKYQEGNEYLQSGKGMKNFLNAMEENSTKLSNASATKEPVEKFDIASLSEAMPDIPRRSPKGSKAPNDTQVGPSRKEMADLMRAYNKKEDAAGRLGYLDEDYLERKFVENQQMVGGKIEPNVKGKIETLSPRMASFKTPQQASMTPKLNMVPVKEQSKAERKAENKRLEGMAKAPITYTDNAFVGPQNFVGPSNMVGPSDQELKSGRIREDAESARKNYEARLAGESARNVYEGKLKGTPMTDALLKSTMSSQAFKETLPAKKNITYTENKGGYARALKSGKVNAKGNLVDPNTGLEYEDLRNKSSAKSGGAKPLIKMKEDSWTEDQWQKFLKDRNKSNTDKTQKPATNTSGKTARHTLEDPGKKMINKNLVSEKKGKEFGLMDKLKLAYNMTTNNPYTKFLPFYPSNK